MRNRGMYSVVLTFLFSMIISSALAQPPTPGGPKTGSPPQAGQSSPTATDPLSTVGPRSAGPTETIHTGAGPSSVFVVPPAKHREGAAGIIDAVASLLWPLVIVAVILLIAFHRRLNRILGLLPKIVRKVEVPGGITLEVDPETAKEIRTSFGKSFAELKEDAESEYKQMVEFTQVRHKLGELMSIGLPAALEGRRVAQDRVGERGTIHVPDIVFKEYLYQLVDYYPRIERIHPAGRRFSMRFGIIGRAWRLKESVGKGDAVSGNPRRKLIEEWGMFEEEAMSGSHARPAYLCVILRSQDDIQGLLFIDSETLNAFGTDPVAQQVADALANHSTCVSLAAAVAETMKPLRLAGPFLEVNQ